MFQNGPARIQKTTRGFTASHRIEFNDPMKKLSRLLMLSRLALAFSTSFVMMLSFQSPVFAADEDQPSPEPPEILILPPPIVHLLEIEASHGTCEARWQEYAGRIGVVEEEVAPGMTLYLIPCALWAHNLAWAAFVTQQEPSHPDGYLTLPIRFVDYSPFEGLVARDVIHNISWDSRTKRLRARFYLNGKEQCGSAGEYRWDTGQRNLLLQTLIKQDQCEGAPGPWTAVYTR
jgi:hypothetical protein